MKTHFTPPRKGDGNAQRGKIACFDPHFGSGFCTVGHTQKSRKNVIKWPFLLLYLGDLGDLSDPERSTASRIGDLGDLG